MACLYVSKTLKEAEKWFDYFISLGRPTFQIVKLKFNGNVFYGDAENCFDARLNEEENLMLVEQYWSNKSFNNNSIIENLLTEILRMLKF